MRRLSRRPTEGAGASNYLNKKSFLKSRPDPTENGAGKPSQPRVRRFSRPGVRASSGELSAAAQELLRASEIRYRRLFEAARDGVLLIDPDTRKITDVNPFMVEFLGFTREEFLGKELWEIGLIKDSRTSQDMFQELRRKRFVRYDDLPLKSTKRGARAVEVVANLSEADALPVIQCNIRDITERRTTEHELAAAKNEIVRHAAQLEETVAERTAQLRETIEELEAFSYSISHDMRAPLRAMRGFAEVLLEKHSGRLDAEGIKFLQKIDLAAGRMDCLIQDVLTYTRVLRGQVKNEPIDLDALVREIIFIYPELQSGGVEVQIYGVLPKVLGNEASLAQSISNLLTNGVKFVAPGTRPRVKVRAEAIAKDVRLWVEDNGIGIAKEDQVRIFEMFERVATAYDGTGIGLAIVRKAIDRMGGRLGVESELGRGSRFWIQLKGAGP